MPRMRGVGIVTVVWSVGCGAAFCLPPDTAASWLDSAAGSPALSQRLQHPWNGFLLDGENVREVGGLFYAEQRFSSQERYALMPQLDVLPVFAADSDTARAAVGWNGGGQAGSAGLPFSNGFLRARVFSNAQVAGEGVQDAFYSAATLPRRAAALGDQPASAAAYFGDDVPPLSLLRGGVEMEQRGGVLAIGYSRGTLWAPSPLTGVDYPLRTQGTEILVGMAEDLSMHFRYDQYSGLSDQSGAPSATLSEIGLQLSGDESPTWGWSLRWAYRKRVVAKGSDWTPLDRSSYPWQFRAGKIWKSEDSIWTIRVRGSLEDDESVLLSTGEADAEEPVNRNIFTQGLRIYHRHPFDSSAYLGERVLGDTALAAAYDLPANGRGAGAWAGYAWRDSSWESGVRATGSLEWETPVFTGATWPPTGSVPDDALSRYGVYAGSDYLLARTQAAAYAEARVGGATRLRLALGWQDFLGHDAGALEFSPAPYFGSLEGGFTLPAHLRADAILQGLGPKYYRGYGLDWRVAPHFENQLGLRQSYAGGRWEARVALFHAFGEAVQEYPLGNPIRFRITAGIRGRLP